MSYKFILLTCVTVWIFIASTIESFPQQQQQQQVINPFAFHENQIQQEKATVIKASSSSDEPFNPFATGQVQQQQQSQSQDQHEHHHTHYTCNSLPLPCGVGAICQMLDNKPICKCPEPLKGDPLVSCDPEPSQCYPSPCGEGAICRIISEKANCSCSEPLKGDPLVRCSPVPSSCSPSPCGPNARCTTGENDNAICTCLENYIGSPPKCRPECFDSSECNSDQSRQLKCVSI